MQTCQAEQGITAGVHSCKSSAPVVIAAALVAPPLALSVLFPLPVLSPRPVHVVLCGSNALIQSPQRLHVSLFMCQGPNQGRHAGTPLVSCTAYPQQLPPTLPSAQSREAERSTFSWRLSMPFSSRRSRLRSPRSPRSRSPSSRSRLRGSLSRSRSLSLSLSRSLSRSLSGLQGVRAVDHICPYASKPLSCRLRSFIFPTTYASTFEVVARAGKRTNIAYAPSQGLHFRSRMSRFVSHK